MADLPSSSFVAVNDIETAQGAPVSEALAQKYGSNENFLNAEKVLNDADIATNTADIATNTADIDALVQPEIFNVTINPNTTSAVFTFSSAPTIVIVRASDSGTDNANFMPAGILTQTTTSISSRNVGNSLTYTLTGAALTVTVSGTFSTSTTFNGAGWS